MGRRVDVLGWNEVVDSGEALDANVREDASQDRCLQLMPVSIPDRARYEHRAFALFEQVVLDGEECRPSTG